MEMEPFVTVTGRAAPLAQANVDTDVIMPKQFLKGVDRSGLAEGVFHGLRIGPEGKPNPDFILNRTPWRSPVFLIVGPNFGCGSSREHAVWGLRQRGIRAIFGSSFGEIFYDNCARNGVLALKLPELDLKTLFDCAADPDRNILSVHLPSQAIHLCDGTTIMFRLAQTLKHQMVRGLDPIGAALRHRNDIVVFERQLHGAQPWLRPRATAN